MENFGTYSTHTVQESDRRLPAFFLGTGGNEPRVSIFDNQKSKVQTYMPLQTNHSVYVIDVSSENSIVAIGTKGNKAFIIYDSQEPLKDTHVMPLQLNQGAPILSLCWINEALLAISDSVSRCLLWNKNRPISPWVLETEGEMIFALVTLQNDALAGLSNTGKIFIWNVFDPSPLSVCDVHMPPSMGAFVKIINWRQKGCLTFPGQGGHLVFFNPQTQKVDVIKAHDGDFYGIAALNEQILTVGMKDGLLKIWGPDSNIPAHSVPIQKDVLSAAVIQNHEMHLMLVDATGALNAYTVADDDVRLVNRITGQDFRIVTSPHQSPETDTASEQAIRNEILQIAADLTKYADQIPIDDRNTYHARLLELGYEHVWHEVWIKHALKKNDIVKALQYSDQLVQKLPKNVMAVVPLMERYAQILKTTCHFEESKEVCETIFDINPNYEFKINTTLLERYRKLVLTENCIVNLTDSAVTMEQIIGSYTILDKIFTGRYLVKKLDPEICKNCTLSPDSVFEKYKKIVEEDRKNKLPLPILENTWLLNSDEPEKIDLITFGDGKSNKIIGILFAVGIFCGETDTIISPYILFDWSLTDDNYAIERANQDAEKHFLASWDNVLMDASFSRTHKALDQALRRLINEDS